MSCYGNKYCQSPFPLYLYTDNAAPVLVGNEAINCGQSLCIGTIAWEQGFK